MYSFSPVTLRLLCARLPTTSASPSPGQSPGSVTPLTPETRRQRDRKHLDDITAARLPPMDHSPAQLLSLEESVTLLKEQTKKHQVLPKLYMYGKHYYLDIFIKL